MQSSNGLLLEDLVPPEITFPFAETFGLRQQVSKLSSSLHLTELELAKTKIEIRNLQQELQLQQNQEEDTQR